LEETKIEYDGLLGKSINTMVDNSSFSKLFSLNEISFLNKTAKIDKNSKSKKGF